MANHVEQLNQTTICNEVLDYGEIKQETWKIFDLMLQTNKNESVITWLAKRRLISNSVKCLTCNNLCTLIDHQEDIDGKIWKCNIDNFTQSVRKGSIFEDSDTSLKVFIWLMYMWSRELLNTEIAHETKVSVTVIDELCQYIRDLLDTFMEDYPTDVSDDSSEIGGFDLQTGKPIVVEINVTTFFKSKANEKSHVKGYRVFGGVERESGKCFLVSIENKNKDVFRSALLRWILPGTHIVSDVWAEYLQIDQMEQGIYTHEYIYYDDPGDSKMYTSAIDRMWLKIKIKLRRKHVTYSKKLFQSYLAEFMWRSRFANEDKFIALIYSLVHLYKV